MKLNIQWKKVLYGIILIVIGIILADRRNVEVLVQNRELRCYQRFHFQYYCSYIGIGNVGRNLYNVKWNQKL